MKNLITTVKAIIIFNQMIYICEKTFHFDETCFMLDRANISISPSAEHERRFRKIKTDST